MHPNRRREWVQDIPDCKFVRLFPSPCTADGLVCQNIICIIGIKNQTSILHDVPACRVAASPGNRDIKPLAGCRILHAFIEPVHPGAASWAVWSAHKTLDLLIFIIACLRIGRFLLCHSLSHLLSDLLILFWICIGSSAILLSLISIILIATVQATTIDNMPGKYGLLISSGGSSPLSIFFSISFLRAALNRSNMVCLFWNQQYKKPCCPREKNHEKSKKGIELYIICLQPELNKEFNSF